jgi:hypothetical protein
VSEPNASEAIVSEPNASEPNASEAESDGGRGGVCMPCRGTGKLISGLGGEPHEVVCPWCRGTGERIAGINAQESPAEAGAPPTVT